MGRWWTLAVAVSMGGCLVTPFSAYEAPDQPPDDGGEVQETGEPASSATAVRPQLDSVGPTDGTDEGGTRVTLKGSDFSEDVVVTFDGKPAQIVSVAPRVLVVETPRNRGATVVDVEVENAAGADVVRDGFQYWPDGSGLIGGLAEATVLRYKGGYWLDTAPVVLARTMFLAPTESMVERFYAPGLDQCFRIDYVGQSASGSVSDQQVVGTGAFEVTWRGGGAAVVLPQASYDLNIFASEPLTVSDLAGASLWSVELRDGFLFPDLTLTDAIATEAPGVEVSQPNINGANPPTVGRSFAVTWSGQGASDGAFLELLHLTPDALGNFSVAQYMSCWMDDDGAFTVPDLWGRWALTADDYLELHVGRASYTETVLPYNSAAFLGIARADAVGALFMR